MIPILALVVAGVPAVAAALPAVSEIDRALLHAELALEESLRGAAQAGCQVPVPDFEDPRTDRSVVPPVIDGDLGDDFWQTATLVRWKALGNSRFRMPFSWKFQVALCGGAFFIGGERAEPPGPDELLVLQATWRERLHLRFRGGGRSRLRLECPSTTGPLDGRDGEFAAVAGDDGIRFELRIARRNAVWPIPIGALRPLRFSASRGYPGELHVSPPYRFIAGALALRVESLEASIDQEIRVGTQLLNYSARDGLVTGPDLRRQPFPAGSRLSLAFSSQPPSGGSGLQWKFRAASVGCELGVITTNLDFVNLPERIMSSLDVARANLRRLGASSTAIDEAIDTAITRVGERVESGDQAIEDLHVEARELRRRTFMAALAGQLDEVLLVRRFHYRHGPFYTTYAHGMPGGNLAVWSLPRGELRNILDLRDEVTVRDADLHFEGKRIVFSMRRPGGTFDLYSVDIDGGTPRRITDGGAQDIEPCWVPGDRIVFNSTRPGSTNPSNETENHSLHIVKEDGSGLRRLGFNYLVDFTPSILADGRVLFLRWAQDDRPGYFTNFLWTIYPDGRELQGFFGMNRVGLTIEARQIPGSNRVVCLEAGRNGHWRSPLVGDIGVIDVHASRNELLYRIEAERGGYKRPFPLGGDIFLVSWGDVNTGWAVYVVDRHGNRELVHRDPGLSCFNAMPVRPRPQPHTIPNLVAADTSVPATLFVQDIYQGLPDVSRGSIDRLRVVAVPEKPPGRQRRFDDQVVPVSIVNRMVRRDLGTVPVHPDGSAFFEVPANVSVFFQALDADGYAVQTMRDTVCFAPGERRSCVGCHEPARLAPPGGRGGPRQALRSPPARLETPAGSSAIHFPRNIQPILDRHCVSCHDASDPAGGIILSGDITPYFNLAYETLTRGGNNDNNRYWDDDFGDSTTTSLAPAIRYVTVEIAALSTGARASRLMRLLERGHENVQLEDGERRELARWIDLNVPYYGDWTTTRLAGERRVLSIETQGVVETIVKVRCRGCHPPPDIVRGAVVSLSRPALSPLLRAPLARSGGGTGRCRKPVFRTRDDGGYRDIIRALMNDSRRLREAATDDSE